MSDDIQFINVAERDQRRRLVRNRMAARRMTKASSSSSESSGGGDVGPGGGGSGGSGGRNNIAPIIIPNIIPPPPSPPVPPAGFDLPNLSGLTAFFTERFSTDPVTWDGGEIATVNNGRTTRCIYAVAAEPPTLISNYKTFDAGVPGLDEIGIFMAFKLPDDWVAADTIPNIYVRLQTNQWKPFYGFQIQPYNSTHFFISGMIAGDWFENMTVTEVPLSKLRAGWNWMWVRMVIPEVGVSDYINQRFWINQTSEGVEDLDADTPGCSSECNFANLTTVEFSLIAYETTPDAYLDDLVLYR